jgi:RNA polymerase-binding transcription factor DksA
MPGTAGKKPAPRRPAGRARATTTAKPAPKKAAKKTPAKKVAAKKPASATKKAPARQPAAKKAPAKKAPAKKPPAKKAPAKKATPVAKKAPAKKATPVAKKAPAKSAPAKTGPAKTAPGKTAPAKGRGGKKTVICPLSGFEVTPGPANLGAKTLQRLRQKLIEEKRRLLHQADDLSAEAEELAREREAGDTQFDEESGEGDTVNVERERDLLLSATVRQVVDEIDDALERIKRNKYGLCKPAGRKIALERLEAIPWAQVCVDCKARAERRR